ncbi:MAG: SpoIIE family protein phosphatase [Candidatus Riflebacteria bacterium]|nr:SpoIIE family protein phosphatase [Candidatus Riflebacteria bacterium]
MLAPAPLCIMARMGAVTEEGQERGFTRVAGPALLVLLFLGVIPCLLADAALRYLAGIREAAAERRAFARLDRELSLVLPNTDPEHLLKRSLTTLARRAARRPRPLPYLKARLGQLWRRFPSLFTFTLLDGQGVVRAQFGGLESRRAAREFWEMLRHYYRHGYLPFDDRLPIVARFLGLTSRARPRLEQIGSGWIETSLGPHKTWLFQHFDPRFAVFANVHKAGFSPLMALDTLAGHAARRGIRIDVVDMVGVRVLGPDATAAPPQVAEMAVRYENEPRKEFRAAGRLWSVAMINTRFRLVASLPFGPGTPHATPSGTHWAAGKPDAAPPGNVGRTATNASSPGSFAFRPSAGAPDPEDPSLLVFRFRAAAAAGLLAACLGLCWILARPRLPWLSIRWKLLALFLGSTAGPLTLLIFVIDAWLGEREDLLVQTAMQHNALLLNEIDLKFPLVTRRWEVDLQRQIPATTPARPRDLLAMVDRLVPFLNGAKVEEARLLASDGREVPLPIVRNPLELGQKGFAALSLSLWRSITHDETLGSSRLLLETDLMLGFLPPEERAGFMEGLEGNESVMIPLELANLKGSFYFRVLRNRDGEADYLFTALWDRGDLVRRHLRRSVPAQPLDDGTELMWIRRYPNWEVVRHPTRPLASVRQVYPSWPRRPLGRDFRAFFRVFLMKQRLAHDLITYKGQPCVVTAFPARLLDQFLLVAVKPLTGIQAEIAGLRQRLLGFGALVCGLAGFFGTLLARKFLAPVEALATGVAAVQGGRLTHRVPLPDPDELGDLTALFNVMTANLEEVSMGREVQARLLPKEPLSARGFRVAGRSLPASQLGGDYFDFQPCGEDRLLIVIGDVTGHGVPAALGMAIAKGLFAEHAAAGRPPLELVTALNRVLRAITPDHFSHPLLMTACVVEVDLATRDLTLFNCGHPFPFRQSPGRPPELVSTGGRLLGIRPDVRVTPLTLRLEPGERLIFYTDGLAESLSIDGDDGFQTLGAWFGTRPPLPAPAACCDILDHHPFVRSGEPLPDDFTVLILEREESSRL